MAWAFEAFCQRARRASLLLLAALASRGSWHLAQAQNSGEIEVRLEANASAESLEAARRLQAPVQTLPTDAALQLGYLANEPDDNSLQAEPSWRPILDGIVASVDYGKVEIWTLVSTFQYAVDARLRLVDGTMDSAEAVAGGCMTSYKDARYTLGSWAADGAPTTPYELSGDPPATRLKSDEPMNFRMGGDYRLCYSANGTFFAGSADVSPVIMRVNGVYKTDCDTTNCLSHRPYRCYLRKGTFSTAGGSYGLLTSCVVDLPAVEGQGGGSWSAEFQSLGYDNSGSSQGFNPSTCGSQPSNFICSNGGACDAGDPFITPAGGFSKLEFPTTRPDLQGALGDRGFRPRTVAACYCPTYDNCDAYTDYVQQVGILHYYLSKVCHPLDSSCTDDFTGMTTQYRFLIRVECPTDACPADGANRIKIVERAAANDLASWDVGNGCRSGIHGEIGGIMRLPPMTYQPIDGSAPGTVNPTNCADSLDCALSGGVRQDYKEFGAPHGFRFNMGNSNHENLQFYNSHDLDVCFCQEQCTVPSNWFKAGAMRLSPTRLVSSATARSNLPDQWMVEFVNQPGIVGLSRPYVDSGALGLQENGVLKMVQDTMKTVTDQGCAWGSFNSQYTEGLASEVDASLNYLGKTNPPETQKIIFNSKSLVNTITVTEPGAVAVCYCALTVDNVCVEQSNWKFLTHVTIKGPRISQRWMFSTNVVFRFSYEGFGLSSGDELRIISSDGSCTDNNYDPNTAAFVYTALSVKCPVPCTQVGLVDSAEPGDLPTQVLSADTWGCDRNNENCKTPGNDITHVVVLSDTVTELTFEHPHGMLTGDEMTLGDNIECDPASTVCTPEMLSALKGVYDFADRDANSASAPESWMAAHRLTTTSDVRKVRINIGWPAEARPLFRIAWAGAQMQIGYRGRGGKWSHHSRASTREEILATEERANLRVCWKFGGNGGKYVEEVGRMTIRNPAVMEGATVSITTTAMGVRAPMILQFTTAGGVTGLRYDEAEDSLRLKIVFTHTNMLDVFYSNLEADVIPDSEAYEVEDGKQSICGRLFLELWSNDIENGFPFPKACYFKTFPGANQRELFMIFDAKNGLKKNTIYQIVFNGRIQDVYDDTGINLIQTNFMELFPMDDVTSRPYEAIERGIVNLAGALPQEVSVDIADPHFSTTSGFKIVGGYQDLLNISSGDSIVAELMGDASSGKITPGCFVRVYLWPLTMWKTTSSCTAECLTGGEVSFNCDNNALVCQGLAAIPGGSLNVLKLSLPPTTAQWDDLYGDRKIRIEIGAITIPSGGFFPQRLGAQVTKAVTDDMPHYVHTVGNYIWKEPNEGQTIAKVISQAGGANTRPFTGDTMNTLYARFTLASTIYAREIFDDDASFVITLPQGYTCLNMNPMPDDVNAWAAEDDLPAFGNIVPQGRGTPDDGTPGHGWSVSGNTCTYRPEHPHGVVFAGSSLIVKITVTNPTTPLPRSDISNVWTIRMRNKGLYHTRLQTMDYPFLATASEMYQSNNGVLGRITQAMCQPTNFEAKTLRDIVQEVRVFFRTELEVAAGGTVRLHAPEAFSFDNPCTAMDLEAPYYATDATLASSTLRLPGIVSCEATGPNLNIAHVRLNLILDGGRYFGFKVRLRNPSGFDMTQQTGWRIFTVDSLGFVVDGTPGTVPFSVSDTDSWGVYQNTDLSAQVRTNDLRPFMMTNQRTYVSLVVSQVPDGPSGSIRFAAPEGYVFRFQESEFVWQSLANNPPEAHRPLVPPGVQANWPAVPPYPASGSSVLLFGSGDFVSSTVYGFAVPVEVPARTPTTSSNAYFLEFGYDAANVDERTGAAEIPAPPVRALKNAAVDYTTTIIGKENALQINIETITFIPEGGGLRMVAPEGFGFETNCEIATQISPESLPPPALSCSSRIDPNEGAGRPVVLLRAGAGGLLPGMHQFAILAENPMFVISNYLTDTTSCGMSQCWSFESYEYLENATQSSSSPLDYQTATQGFSIRQKMLEARIPPLSEEQQRATFRDDRPMQSSNVIFAFKLAGDATQSGELLLRGPYGFQFAQECLQEIEVSETSVFGFGNRFPAEFDAWPAAVQISHCRGTGPDAVLQVTIPPGSLLERNKLYLFRIRIMANPRSTPQVNRWNIMFAGEASEPIEGFTLWSFTRTSVTPVTTARDRTLAGEQRTRNPLRIMLRPYNTVPTDGELRGYAPEGFQFAHRPSLECDVQLEELPYTRLGVQYPGYTWPSAGLVCLVQGGDTQTVSIRLRDAHPLSADLDYRLILYVYNPATALPESGFSEPTMWTISSFNERGLSLDESTIEAFRINTVTNLWSYSNPNPQEPGEEMRNGDERLPDFKLMMRFPDVLTNMDTIHIIVPPGFILTDSTGRCRGFAWVSEDPDAEEGWSPLPNSRPPACNESTMTIYIAEPEPVARDTLLQFRLEIFNPLMTPFMGDNFWRITHYGPPSTDGVRTIHSSNAFTGWDIIPQLENVEILLSGQNRAAESQSSITVKFTAVSDAQDVAILFNDPPDFDFSNAQVDDPMMQIKRPDTGGPLIRLRSDIRSGDRVIFTLSNVILGRIGGQTDISITTWVGGMLINNVWQPGTKRDEKLNFLGGFRLPGKITRLYDRLENNYHQNPGTYPVQASWSSQMGRPAYATFRFLLTRPAEVGHYLIVRAPPYELMRRLFVLQEAPDSVLQSSEVALRQIGNEITDVVNGELHTRLTEQMNPNVLYELITSVIAPHPLAVDAHDGPVKWIIETSDLGEMPTNTNDGTGREFPIVEEYTFDVRPVTRAPPTAEIEVEVSVVRGPRDRNHPTELTIVAPLGFNFSDGCLVYGGDEVLSCDRHTPTPDGRATAKLTCVEAGIRERLEGIIIKTTTPSRPPVAPAWFVEGTDWLTGMQWGWGEAAGIEVEQMADTAVAYPGIGGVESLMVWRFRCQVMVQAGGWLHVVIPDGLDPKCDGQYFTAVALPTTGGCDVLDSQNLQIYLNSTIVPGEYSFGFTVTPPLATPIRNQLSLILKDHNGQVKDAAVDLPGVTIYEKLKIGGLPLQWTASKPLRSSVITIGFEAIEPLPDIIVAPNQQISEILITLPVGFQHLVGAMNEFTLVNEDMPLRGAMGDGMWLDFMQKDRLRVIMELNRTSWTTLKTGRYQFRFPVLVPSPLPVFNVWHMSLCSPNFPEGCSRITDPAVMVTYAMPGFALGERYGSSGILTAGAVRGRGAAAAVAFLPVLLLLLTSDLRR